MPADESLAVQLNEAAQAAARLADKTPNAELTGRASAACEGPVQRRVRAHFDTEKEHD